MLNKKIVLLCTSLFITGTLFTGCTLSTTAKETTTQASQSNYKEVTVEKGNVKEVLSLTGSLVTKDKDTLTTSKSSTVSEVYVKQNDKVTEGQDLILLDNGTVIEAPYAGLITKVNVAVGDAVNSQTELLNIVDNSDYFINATIDESDISKVKLGQESEVKVTALNKEYKGKISYISGEATVSGNRATFNVTVDLDGDFIGLYYGLSSEADIILKDAKDVLTIPIEAVTVKGNKKTVNVKNGDTFVEKEVTLGTQDSSYVEVVSGLKEGDVIKVQTAQRFQNGNMQGGGSQGGNFQNGNFQGGNMQNRGSSTQKNYQGGNTTK